MFSEQQEIRLEDIFAVFRRRWKLIIFGSLLVAAITAVVTILAPDSYESYALLRIGMEGSQPLESFSSITTIMTSLPSRKEIARRLDSQDNDRLIDSLTKTIQYNEMGNLLKISAIETSPEKAARYVEAAAGMVNERHKIIYEESQKRLKVLIKEIKENIQPIPLSAGINEFRNRPTTIEIHAIVDPKPMKTTRRKSVITSLLATFFATSLLALFLENNSKRKEEKENK
ncbi:MAG: hypothetical protein A2219_03160 [Elusimicrobia bacterium RIFOXYA2_FULL_50_26]|nr:MAG: hypothetical protein A2219_03160 [Elusimicrobia bacterium RIFOXYA2_FULL_50_26]OGS24938.1 MAG: hypothetical protein A2314_07875 [Elusimicrobia bacterium RIFOXYB2_FULL_50_12]